MSYSSRLPGWRLERHGEGAELRLTGDWIARDSGVRGSADVRRILDEAGGLMLRVDASELVPWSSALDRFFEDALCDSLSLQTKTGSCGSTGPRAAAIGRGRCSRPLQERVRLLNIKVLDALFGDLSGRGTSAQHCHGQWGLWCS